MSTSTGEKGKASKQASLDKAEVTKGTTNDLDESVEQLSAPKKKLHTEQGEKVVNPLDIDDMDEKPTKRRGDKEGKSRRRGQEEDSDEEYEGEEEEEDYLDDDGEITSEHSDRSGDFDLDEYMKFRETAPDYPDDEEEENGEGEEGEEEEEDEEEEAEEK